MFAVVSEQGSLEEKVLLPWQSVSEERRALEIEQLEELARKGGGGGKERRRRIMRPKLIWEEVCPRQTKVRGGQSGECSEGPA